MDNLYISCEKCKAILLLQGATVDSANRDAKLLGWMLVDGKQHCPKCAKQQRATDKQPTLNQ